MSELNRNEALARCKADGLAPVWCIVGEQTEIRDDVVSAIESAIFPGGSDDPNKDLNYERIDWKNQSLNAMNDSLMRVLEGVSTMPFLAAKRMVVVRDFSFSSPSKSEDEDSGVAILKRLVDYVAAPNASACLVVVADSLDKRTSLAKSFVKNAVMVRASIDKKEYKKEAKRMAEELDVRLASEALDLLVEHYQDDLTALRQELNKLASFAGSGEVVRYETVEALTLHSQKNWWFELTGAIADGDAGSALHAVKALSNEGLPVHAMLPSVAKRLRLIFIVKSLSRTFALDEVAERSGQNKWFVRNTLLPAAKKFGSEKHLKKLLDQLAELDVKIKSSSCDANLLFENELLAICKAQR